MADNSVDSIILEIESSTIQADKGLEKLGKALKNIQSATSGTEKIVEGLTTLKNAIDKMEIGDSVVNSLDSVSQSLKKLTTSIRETSFSNLKKELEDIESLSVGDNLEKLTTEHRDLSEEVKKSSNLNTTALTTVVNSLNGLHVDSNAGDNIKKIGSGFQSIANATSKVKSENIEALREMGDVINKVSAGLGDLGKNNNVTIKIDANGVKNVAKPIDNVSESAQKLTKEVEKAKAVAQQLKQVFSILNTDFSTGAHTSKEYAQSIKVLESAMKQVLNGKMELKDSDYEKLRIKIIELKERFKEFKEETSQSLRTTGVDNMSKSIQSIIDKQKEYSRVVSDMESGKEGFDWKEYQKATVELEKLNGAMKAYQMVAKIGTPSGLNMLADVCRKASEEMNKLAGIGLKVLRTIGSPFIALASVVKKQLSGITANFRDMSKNVRASLKKMSDFWKRTMKTFTFMVVRKAITAVIDNIKEAVDSLALWSKAMDTPFNESISNIVADFKYMARSILAAVEPLINAVAPLLNKLADMFSNLMSKVAQFFAALTGQSYYMKAKKNVKDYASSVDKASKKAKGALQSFDELNNITTNDNNADNPLSGFKDEWEKLPVDKKAKELADKLKAALADLWRPIGIAWDRMKDYVLGGWKYMTGELKKLFKDVWDDFIEVWNQEATIKIFENIFGIIGDMEYVIGNIAKRFREAWNYNDTGKHILENIRDIIGVIVQHVRNVTIYMKTWSDSLDFKPILTSFEKFTKALIKVADFLGGEFEDIMKLGVLRFTKWLLEKGAPGVLDAMTAVIDQFDFSKIRKDIKPVIIAVEKLMENLISGITKAGEALGKKIADWFNSDKFTKFTQAIKNILGEFTSDRIAAVLEGIGTAFLDIASALAAIVSSKAVVGVFKAVGKIIDSLGAKGIANVIKSLAGFVAFLVAESAKLAVVGSIIAGIAKVKFAWNIASVAKDLGNIGKTASTVAKTAEGLSTIEKSAKGIQAVGGLKAFMTADIGQSLAAGGATAGATVGTAIAASIVTAVAAYGVTNKIMQYIMPDDAELYKKYRIGGEGNLFTDWINPDESLTENWKDALDALVQMTSDFENHPVIATLASGTLLGAMAIPEKVKRGFEDIISGANEAKATLSRELGFTKENAYDKALEQMRQGIGFTQEQLKSLNKDFGLTSDQMDKIRTVNNDIQAIAEGTKMRFSQSAQAILDENDALKKQEEQIKRVGFSVEDYQKKLRQQVGTGEYSGKFDAKTFDASKYQEKAFNTERPLERLKAERDKLVSEIQELQNQPGFIVKDEDIEKMNLLNKQVEELNKKIYSANTGSKDTGKNITDGIAEGATAEVSEGLFQKLFEGIKNAINRLFGIESPATSMFDTGKNIILGIIEGFNLVDFMSQMQAWWDTNIVPWFTLEKWSELATGIKDGIKIKWDETVVQWQTDIASWWDTNVAPWFTQEKWAEVLSGIEPAFKEAFKGAVNVAIEALNKLLEGIEKMINEAFGADGLGKIGEYASKVGIELDLNFSPVKIPRIPKFEKGGFPEDGIFAANHNELVGQFNNGRTAVANNGQIIDGISNGVQQANAQQNVLFNQMIDLLGVIADKDLTIGDDAVFGAYQRGASRYGKRYGVGI